MNVMIERYYGYGKTYLIWDIVKNHMYLGPDKVKHIKRSNLFLDECEILVGPIGSKENMDFLAYDRCGRCCEQTIQNKGVFRKYMNNKVYTGKMKESIYSVGFIILNCNFVKELEEIRCFEGLMTDKNTKKAI